MSPAETAWEYESQWDSCDVCDHTYRLGEACQGDPVPCAHCCANHFGEIVYTPTYVIKELAL